MKKSFAELTKELPHRPIVEKALSHVDHLPKIAIDCGCGAGNESSFLLSKNFKVHAFDPSIEAKNICLSRFKDNNNFSFSNQTFEAYSFPKASLIIALFSLFFCPAHSLENVLEKMKNSLNLQGILLIQFLGKDDAWVVDCPEKFLGFEQEELKHLFNKEFDILFIDELKDNKPLANGTLKFWNVHTLILKKKR
ncbi:TPA: class I SAM-dependent methyltransferase [Acinetobacter baumannii]|uniref:class I SAM-dependent methyltransferase n=1 Tax=Acinetobacter baumannii TaxID=470 RepID=UPI000F84213B|nr:class I SAM-dependent methyltransferase [Acinetobacter baumannii]MBD0137391.1 class I SAM-dependent methyltransferase [Acinetobacter baumannii]MBD0209670.1 class I SAM-dependent methyltransferase [Acinetobacter baumannii]MBD0230467.1 class I SAM-dependent methyltransferase [Acinetobacter baumannii]RTY09478.1 class I SAM-dependent methyltransferase [Acinetobacter baumannii]HAV3010468.1 class I SAM-dependent methyltransferase [Acinetobacter baumannii]